MQFKFLIILFLSLSTEILGQEPAVRCFYDSSCFTINKKFDTLYYGNGERENAFLIKKWKRQYTHFKKSHKNSTVLDIKYLFYQASDRFNLSEYVPINKGEQTIDSVVKWYHEYSIDLIVEIEGIVLRSPILKDEYGPLYFDNKGILIFIKRKKSGIIYYSMKRKSAYKQLAFLDYWLKENQP